MWLTLCRKKIQDIGYASPRLWNQLPDYSVSLASHVSTHLLKSLVSSSLSSSPLSSSITPSLFHSRLKTYLFNKSSHLNTSSTPDCLHDHGTGPNLSCFSIYFKFVFFFNFSVSPVWWTKLATHQLFTARLIQCHNIVSYGILFFTEQHSAVVSLHETMVCVNVKLYSRGTSVVQCEPKK